VQIWGKAITTIHDRGFPVLHDVRIVLFHTVMLWSSQGGAIRPKCPQQYRISYPLPTYARSRGTALPPTTSMSFQSLDVDVRYNIKIDMVRQGFHRHECTSTVFYYLPRSIPTSLNSIATAFEEVEAKSDATEGVQWHLAEVAPRTTGETSAIVQFGLPLPLSYTAGTAIPFRVEIVCPGSMSEESLRTKLDVRLVKIVSVSVAVDRQRIRMDQTLGKGDIWKIDMGNGSGIWEITGSVKGGKEGGEVSWSISNFVEVRYAVRLVIAGEYRWEQVVQMVTDEREAFEVDEARERPALRLMRE